jgi:hypothetical protein
MAKKQLPAFDGNGLIQSGKLVFGEGQAPSWARNSSWVMGQE